MLELLGKLFHRTGNLKYFSKAETVCETVRRYARIIVDVIIVKTFDPFQVQLQVQE